jgi:hypothetical protein
MAKTIPDIIHNEDKSFDKHIRQYSEDLFPREEPAYCDYGPQQKQEFENSQRVMVWHDEVQDMILGYVLSARLICHSWFYTVEPTDCNLPIVESCNVVGLG